MPITKKITDSLIVKLDTEITPATTYVFTNEVFMNIFTDNIHFEL